MRVFSFPFGKKKVLSPLELRQAQLLEDLTETRRQLAAARCLFQQASDQDLVAASVYEINALQARYSYLLHQAKLHEVRRSAWAAS